MPDLGRPYQRSRSGVTKMHGLWLQSEPLNPASVVAVAWNLLSRFIISCWERGTRSSRNSTLGLLCKNGGWACRVHVDAQCFCCG